jgi:hypothetical protein
MDPSRIIIVKIKKLDHPPHTKNDFSKSKKIAANQLTNKKVTTKRCEIYKIGMRRIISRVTHG